MKKHQNSIVLESVDPSLPVRKETTEFSAILYSRGKSIYLLILMLISVNFFHFKPASSLTNQDVCLVLFFLWMLVGIVVYKPRKLFFSIVVKSWYWPIIPVWLGVFISFFAAKELYDQSFVTSFITSRKMLTMLVLPVLGVVKPKIKDLERATIWFSLILLAFAILDAIGVPIIDRSFFVLVFKPDMEVIDEDSFVMCLPGFHWVAMALFFYLHKLKKNLSVRNLAGCIFFISAIFLLQNRSMLAVSAVLFGYVLLTLKTNNKKQTIVFRSFSVILLLAMVAASMPQLIKLATETTTQLGSDDYNRILAYNYFLFEACPSFIYYLTGMGFISDKASSIMMDLMESGIFNSDVGFIGYWNYYGIIPIIAFCVLIYQALKKNTPFYVKANGLLILFGSITLSCFNLPDKILWLCMFIYMIYYKPKQNNAQSLSV